MIGMPRFARSSLVLMAAVGSLAAPVMGRQAAPEKASILKLSWLAGCWEGGQAGRRIEEQWMAPGGGAMLGMGRTVKDARLVEHEAMIIREEQAGLTFTAKPSGQQEASFSSIELTDASVVFENPAHDFPQRVIYRRQGDGSLLARIEGTRDGKVKGIDIPMRRAECAGPSGR